MGLTAKVLIGMLAGMFVGLGINLFGLGTPESFIDVYIM